MSEPQVPPPLSVVDDLPSEEPVKPRRSARAAAPWLALALAVLFAWLWLNQLEGAQRLEQQLTLLETELSSARTDLAAWESHMQDVRSGIAGVAGQIDALRVLVAVPPGEPLAAAAPGSPPPSVSEPSETEPPPAP